MDAKDIIKEYWDYDIDYYDEYENKVSFICQREETAIDLDLESGRISIYRFFTFYDDSYDDDEMNIHSHVMQEAFSTFIENKTSRKWDSVCDEDPMCPGGNILVGFFDVLCSKEIIEEFQKLNSEYDLLLDTEEKAINYIVKYYNNSLYQRYGKRIKCSIEKGRYALEKCNQVEPPFIGYRYCFIKSDEKVFSCDKEVYERILHSIESINYESNMFYILNDEELIIQGNICYAKLTVMLQDKKRNLAEIEEAFLIQRINEFSKFASERMQGFSEYYLRKIPDVSTNENIPLIITEGMTDWMYIEWVWKKIQQDKNLREKYKDIKFNILRHAPNNYTGSGNFIKMQMDCSTLLAMCQSYAKVKRGLFIFISDRDVSINIKQMGSGEAFKKWGTGVYSFVLPIPEIRKDTPDICIEHYFSDDEIKTIKIFPDGIERRLYLSNEFDQYGRAPSINRFCTNRSACADKKVKILDGTGNDRIISLNDINDQTNYGLPKMEFAKSVISDPTFSHISFKNFLMIFDLIQEICKDINAEQIELDYEKSNAI